MRNAYYVYIMTNRRNGTLYVGVTSDIGKRVREHKISSVPGFTQRYGLSRLVYYEAHDDPDSAIVREKSIKRWRRDWKIELIEKSNPEWWDLGTSC